MMTYINPELLKGIIEKILNEREENNNTNELLHSTGSLLGTRKTIRGAIFLEISILTGIDIDILCARVFSNTTYELLVDLSKAKTKLHAFMMIHSNSDRKISELTGIETSRLSRLQDGKIKDMYADEVYSIASIFGLKPSQLFDYFYGNGERPIIGLVPPAEEKKGK